MEDYKKLLTDLYTVHDPERLKQIDYFLEKYQGEEKQFYLSQKAKYKNKKPVSDSKSIIEEALARIKSKSTDKPESKIDFDKKPKISIENDTKDVSEIKDQNPDTEEEIKPTYKTETILVSDDKPIETPSFTEDIKMAETKDEVEKDKPLSSISSPKENVWFNEKKKTYTPPQKTTKKSYVSNDKHFNQKYFLYIFGIVLLVITLAVSAFFIFFYSPVTKQNKIEIKPETAVEKEQIKEEPKEILPETPKPSIEKKEDITTPKPEPKPEIKIETVQQKQAATIISGMRILKGSIPLPAFFVACSAVKNEKIAQKKVRDLKVKGFAASYYWIPDFINSGNPYFKVVVGPFTTRMAAMRKLTPVQERAEFDAYVFELK